MKIAEKLAYQFNDKALLELALRHRSKGSRNNERLEFLGDSILNMVIAEEVFKRKPNSPEGELSRLRASLVKGDTLAKIGLALDLGDSIALGQGELKSGGFRRESIIADAVEAIIGAVYLDSNFEKAKAFVLSLFVGRLEDLPSMEALKDPKTRLQELMQSRNKALPVYSVVNITGKDHKQLFHVECASELSKTPTQAKGVSRRKAEQEAAERMFERLSKLLSGSK